MEKVNLQADLKKLQSYRSSLESFQVNLENKASELTDELETAGKYGPNIVGRLTPVSLAFFMRMQEIL